MNTDNEDGEEMSKISDDVKPEGKFQQFLFAFAIYNNTKRLVYGRGKQVDKELEILNGVRFISIVFVILGHTFLYSLRGPTSNPLAMLEWFDDWLFSIIQAAPYAVDVFFWLSGFLGSYLMLELMKKKNGKSQPYLMVILHRFLRLAPLYLATLFFFWQIMAMVGTGPVFFKYTDEYAGACNDYWWSHLLFINNFYPFTVDEQCMGWTWYLPNDMQFFLILPPLVVLCYKYRTLGIGLIGAIMISSFIASVIILQLSEFGPSLFRIKENYYRVYYTKPYMRIPPFLIGIYLGIFLYAFRNDESSESIIKRF